MTSNDENKTEATPGIAESTGSKFYTLLTGWGIPAVAAAAIVGTIYAALVALGILTLPGCTLTLDILPDGEQHFDGTLVLPQTVNPAK